MRSSHTSFMCFPSVVCTGKETTVAITPRDINRYFHEDRNYQLLVYGLDEDQIFYYTPPAMDHPCYVKNGCLFFTHHFRREQEYIVRFREEGGTEFRISLYAVAEDLYQLRPLKGDLHCHSTYSDGSDGAAMTPADYREEGFDFFALTDHNRMYPSAMIQELYTGIPLGMHMLSGEEIHTPGTALHIVHVGGNSSVCDLYFRHPEAYEAAVDEIAATLSHVPELYRRRTAMAKWACDRVHEAGGMAILAHPSWCPLHYNVTLEFADILFSEKIFDAFELLNGIQTKFNNMHLALWQEQCAKGNGLPVVGSTDSHKHDSHTGVFGRRFTLVFARENTTQAIMEAIRSGYSLAGELPDGSDTDVRFYGSCLRLVRFAHFLFENYFNETLRLCVGEGILMRRYAEGEAVADALAACADTVENFYKRYYGLTAFEGLSQERLAYLDACSTYHCTESPATKGATLVMLPGNRNKRQE